MKPSIFIAAGFVLGAAVSPLRAQRLGPVSLPLGWERQVILNRLAKYYDVDSTGVVRSRSNPPHAVVGRVTFADGRLTSVSRDWTPARNQADAGIGAILSALAQLQGGLACRVQAPGAPRPAQGEVKAIDVVCGAHSVSIVSSPRGHAGEPARPTVHEVWRVRAFSESDRSPPAPERP